MPNLNKCTFIGNLTIAPQIRHTSSGSTLCEFSLAVHRPSKGERSEVLFLDCVAWGKIGENLAKYLNKGGCIFASGYLKQDQWQAQDGSKRSRISLVCEEIQYIHQGSWQAQQGVATQRRQPEDCPPPPNNETLQTNNDIPF